MHGYQCGSCVSTLFVRMYLPYYGSPATCASNRPCAPQTALKQAPHGPQMTPLNDTPGVPQAVRLCHLKFQPFARPTDAYEAQHAPSPKVSRPMGAMPSDTTTPDASTINAHYTLALPSIPRVRKNKIYDTKSLPNNVVAAASRHCH